MFSDFLIISGNSAAIGMRDGKSKLYTSFFMETITSPLSVSNMMLSFG